VLRDLLLVWWQKCSFLETAHGTYSMYFSVEIYKKSISSSSSKSPAPTRISHENFFHTPISDFYFGALYYFRKKTQGIQNFDIFKQDRTGLAYGWIRQSCSFKETGMYKIL
jgi:hypothetical protein